MHLVTFERRRREEPADPGRERERSGSMGDAALGFENLDSVRHGSRRLGALLQLGPHAGAIVDLNRALAIKLAYDDVGAPEAEADSLIPADVLAFLGRLPASADSARAAHRFVTGALEQYDAPDVVRAGLVEARRNVRLCAPVPRPGKIVGIARNYPPHTAERGADAVPEEPILFLKAPSAVVGPEDEIRIPTASACVDFEGELAAVIGTRARDVNRDEALEHVAGYCVANDVTARDFQNTRGQAYIGKSCDTFAPLGPALVSADEIGDPQDLAIRTLVSGEVMQSARTKEMVFSLAEIIAFASRLMTLEPGDIVLTGTPAGVGAERVPPRWLRDGDVVEVEIEGVGRLRNYVRAERPGSREEISVGT
jgi:2-keto-4-pentenoate hydratase/2-oxohepta-3-ene-1,7-dioic acid hydratase in catechol pathway